MLLTLQLSLSRLNTILLRFQQGSFYCSSVSQSFLDRLNELWDTNLKARIKFRSEPSI